MGTTGGGRSSGEEPAACRGRAGKWTGSQDSPYRQGVGEDRASLRSPAHHSPLPFGNPGEDAGAGRRGAAGGRVHAPGRHPHRPRHQHAVPHQRQTLLLPRRQQARRRGRKCAVPVVGAPNGTWLCATEAATALVSPLHSKGPFPHALLPGWDLAGWTSTTIKGTPCPVPLRAHG